MKDQSKTKQVLIQELASLKQKIADLERTESERKRAEEALREREEQYRILAENSPSMIFLLDAQGNVLIVNEKSAAQFGMKPDAMTGRNVRDLFPERIAEQHMQAIKKVIRDGEMIHRELSEPFPTGERWIDARIVPVRNKNGTIIAVLGISHDITDRKQAEEALRESEERMKAIFESVQDFIFVKDVNRRYLSINNFFQRRFDVDPSVFLGYTDAEIPIFENKDMTESIIQDTDGLVLQGEAVHYELTHRVCGTFISFDIMKTPIRDAQGHITGICGLSRDITKRERAEEALKQSEERYRTILEEIEEGYQEVDLSGNFTFFNESFRKIFGYSEDELLGSNFRRYAADEETADRVYRAYNQMYKTGNPLKRFEWDIITKDGTRRSIEFSASLLRDGEGHRRGFRGIVRDVTERKFVEEQYRTMANSAQTGVYIIQDGLLCFVNPYILAYSGYPEEELIGERILQFVHPDDRTMVREMARKMLTGVLTTPYEYRIVDKNNQVRWFMETVTPISYKGMSAVLGNTMDTTERKWVEEARRSSEQRLSDIIEFLPDATLVVNRDGKVIAWNRAIEEMTGIKAEDMLGKGDYEYALPFYGERRSILIDLALHPEPEREKSYTNIERKGDILFGEAYTPGLIGGKTHLSATASVLRNAKGEIVAAIVNVSGTIPDADMLRKTFARPRKDIEAFLKMPRKGFTGQHRGEESSWPIPPWPRYLDTLPRRKS